MKRKMIRAFIIIIPLLLLFLAGWYYCFVHLAIGPAFPFMRYQELPLDSTYKIDSSEFVASDQLFTLADTEEAASQIADMYGITLVSFQNGTAVYHTEEDPQTVIDRGKELGYPELFLNIIRTFN